MAPRKPAACGPSQASSAPLWPPPCHQGDLGQRIALSFLLRSGPIFKIDHNLRYNLVNCQYTVRAVASRPFSLQYNNRNIALFLPITAFLPLPRLSRTRRASTAQGGSADQMGFKSSAIWGAAAWPGLGSGITAVLCPPGIPDRLRILDRAESSTSRLENLEPAGKCCPGRFGKDPSPAGRGDRAGWRGARP